MRKLFTFLLLVVMTLPLMATEDTSVTLYENATGTTCTTGWDNYQQIQATSFTDAKIADLIKVTVSEVGAGNSHLIAFSDTNDNWKMMDGTQWFTITETGTYSFVINATMLAKLQAGGLIVGGCDYTFTKVELVKRPSKTLKVTNLRNTEFTKDKDWKGDWVSFDATNFADINEGDQLLVSVKSVPDASVYSAVVLQTADGNTQLQQFGVNDKTLPRVLPFYFTSSLMNTAKEKGIAVTGNLYTATSVDLVQVVDAEEPAEETTLWEGEQAFDNGWNNAISFTSDKFDGVGEGSKIKIHVTVVDTEKESQGIQLQTGTYKAFKTDMNYWFYQPTTPMDVEFTLSKEALKEISSTGGLNIKGINFTTTKVTMTVVPKVETYTASLNITQPDWTWTTGTPEIGLKLTNKTDAALTLPVKVVLTTDKDEAVATYEQNVELTANEENKEVSITLSDITAPGIYRFTASVDDELVKYTRPEDSKYTWATLNIAYKPTDIVSEPDAQSDFKEYWEGVKAQLAAIDMNAQLALVEEGQYRNLYTVTLNSIPNGTTGDPIQIRGYYAEMKAEGTYPTIVNFQGYDSDDTKELWHPTADSNTSYNELVISARGQSFGNRGDYKTTDNIYCNTTGADVKDFNIKDGKWFTYHFGDLNSYYYRGAYMDQVRGIDFVYSRDKVDKNNIFVTGGSQGGAFTLVATALCGGKVNAIAPAIQFMGDFPDYFQVGNWPVSEAKAAAAMQGMSDEEMYQFLSYYDTKNFASMITAPTLSSIGLQDNVCPAHTNLAPYNLLTCEKELYINKNLVHECPYLGTNNSSYDWNTLTTNWWTSHMKHPQSAETGASAWEAAAGTGAVQYTQDLEYGKYSTICLPYNAKATGAVVMNLVSKTEESGVLKSLTFQITGATESASNTLTAGMPYLVRSTAEDSNVTYTRTDTEDAGDVAAVTTANGFTGVYSNTMVVQGDYYLYTDKTAGTQYFAPSNGFVSAAPFRAYIKSSDVEIIQPQTSAAKAKVILGFNGTTAINSISADNIQVVQPTGKYIRNGRLIIVKDGKEYNAAGTRLK